MKPKEALLLYAETSILHTVYYKYINNGVCDITNKETNNYIIEVTRKPTALKEIHTYPNHDSILAFVRYLVTSRTPINAG